MEKKLIKKKVYKIYKGQFNIKIIYINKMVNKIIEKIKSGASTPQEEIYLISLLKINADFNVAVLKELKKVKLIRSIKKS